MEQQKFMTELEPFFTPKEIQIKRILERYNQMGNYIIKVRNWNDPDENSRYYDVEDLDTLFLFSGKEDYILVEIKDIRNGHFIEASYFKIKLS